MLVVLSGLLGSLAAACIQNPQANASNESAAETGDSSSESSASSTSGGDPDGWTPVLQSKDIGALMSIWGASPDVLYVVGGQPEPNGAVILRGHDDSWETETIPADLPMLNWVYGVDDQVWSVGTSGVILHHDAGVWTRESSPTDRVLWGLWGASADELWAVGGDAVSDQPVLLRRDGASSTWSSVELPPLGVTSHGLFKIWGRAADDVWIVGDAGAILHWDGVDWTATPDLEGTDLISVWGSDNEGVIAVGGRASGRVDRLQADVWIGQTQAVPGLNGVWVDPEGGATTVGVQGTIHRISPGGFELEAEDSGTSMVLHSVFGFSGGPRYAVGGSLLMPPPFVGVILRTD